MSQRIRIEKSFDFAIVGQRNRARLFRHDDCNRVGFLRYADRRAMPRSEFLAQSRFHRQRQEASRRGNAAVLDDHGSVVQRHRRIENRHQQIVGKRRIDARFRSQYSFSDRYRAGSRSTPRSV